MGLFGGRSDEMVIHHVCSESRSCVCGVCGVCVPVCACHCLISESSQASSMEATDLVVNPLLYPHDPRSTQTHAQTHAHVLPLIHTQMLYVVTEGYIRRSNLISHIYWF